MSQQGRLTTSAVTVAEIVYGFRRMGREDRVAQFEASPVTVWYQETPPAAQVGSLWTRMGAWQGARPSSPALWSTLFGRSCDMAERAAALGFTHRVPAPRRPSWLDAYAASATGSSE